MTESSNCGAEMRRQPQEAPDAQPTLLTIAQLCTMLGVSRSTVERLVRSDASFPQAIRLGQRGLRFRAEDVTRFVTSVPYVEYIDHGFDPNARLDMDRA